MNNHRISRRSFLAAAGMAGAAAALTACGGAASSAASSVASSAAASSEAAQSVELIVFAAASLTETLNAIGECYTADHPEVTFRFNFDSSGTLKTQIQDGADCDLFISAGQKQMMAKYEDGARDTLFPLLSTNRVRIDLITSASWRKRARPIPTIRDDTRSPASLRWRLVCRWRPSARCSVTRM